MENAGFFLQGVINSRIISSERKADFFYQEIMRRPSIIPQQPWQGYFFRKKKQLLHHFFRNAS
jgi:hypothetical protein